MKAIILAAGNGTRLKPYTNYLPKVLMSLDGHTLLYHNIQWLKRNGITEIAINTHHKHHILEAYINDWHDKDIKFTISYERTLLGTAGAVKKLESYFDDTFVVVYGDVLTNIDLSSMAHFHYDHKSIASLVVDTNHYVKLTGNVVVDIDWHITDFIEKPTNDRYGLKNWGIYILDKKIFKYIPDGVSDFGKDIFPSLLKNKEQAFVYWPKHNEYLVDCGDIERYEQAKRDVASGKVGLQ